MPQVQVKVAEHTGASSYTDSLPNAVQAGNLLTLQLSEWDAAGASREPHLQVSDNLNGAWTKTIDRVGGASGGEAVSHWHVWTKAGSPVITLNWGAGNNTAVDICLREISGCDSTQAPTTDSFDDSANNVTQHYCGAGITTSSNGSWCNATGTLNSLGGTDTIESSWSRDSSPDGQAILLSQEPAAALVGDRASFTTTIPRGNVGCIASFPHLPPGPSATIAEQALPANHAGNINVHLTGRNTSWSAQTGFVASGIAGWSVSGVSVTDATHAVVTLTPPVAASPPNGATGTLTLTEQVTGSVAASTNVGTPTLSVSPGTGQLNGQTAVTFTGANTLWTTENASILFGSNGPAIGGIAVSANGAATATIADGATIGTFTITDESTGATCAFSVGLTQTTYDVTQPAAYTQYARPEGNLTLGTFSGQTAWGNVSNYDAGLHFKTAAGGSAASIIEVLTRLDGSPIHVVQDGTDIATVAVPNTGGYGYVTLLSGLDATNAHDFVLCWGNQSAFQGLRLTGCLLNTAYLPVRRAIAGFGDSITAGMATGAGDTCTSWLRKLCNQLNAQPVNYGLPSAQVAGAGGLATKTAEITVLIPAPEIIVFLGGTNDAAANTTQAVFGAAYLQVAEAFQSANPGAVCLYERITKISVGDTSRDSYSATVQSEVAALNDATGHSVYDQTLWTNYDGSSGVHPNAAQCTTLANAMAAVVGPLLK